MTRIEDTFLRKKTRSYKRKTPYKNRQIMTEKHLQSTFCLFLKVQTTELGGKSRTNEIILDYLT